MKTISGKGGSSLLKSVTVCSEPKIYRGEAFRTDQQEMKITAEKLRHIEVQRLVQQQELDAERSRLQRNQEGQFATPPALAESITRVALSFLPEGELVRWLETSLGSGSFFSALVRSAGLERIKRALGVEIDPRFVRAARAASAQFGLEVVEHDFTTMAVPEPSDRANLCVSNPPYVRHHHLAPEQKKYLHARVQEQTGIDISGLAGLYVYFLLLSHAWMKEAGVGAWLIPGEWMDVSYGSGIRQFLTETVTPLRIHLFDAAASQFGDAQVSSSVLFFRNVRPTGDERVRLTMGSDLNDIRQETEVTVSQLAQEPKWSPIIRGDQPVGQNRQRGEVLLGHLFQCCRGVMTGCNHFFIRPVSEFQSMGVPRKYLVPILPSSRHLTESTLRPDCDGYLGCPEPLALLSCPPMAELQSNYPHLAEYLTHSSAAVAAAQSKTAETRAKAGTRSGTKSDWYKQEHREPPLFVINNMGRASKGAPPFRAFLNGTRAIATNTYNLLYPKGYLAIRLAEDPGIEPQLLGLLQKTLDEEYPRHARASADGVYRLVPGDLEDMQAGRIAAALGLPLDAASWETDQ